MFPDGFSTTRLILRPIVAEDADPIFYTYAQDPAVTRFLVWAPHQAVADTETYVGHCLTTPADIGRTYVLVGRDDGRLRGAFDLRRPASHRVEFGYVLGRSFWGSGLMTAALREVVGWSLLQPAIFRIEAGCDADHPTKEINIQRRSTNQGSADKESPTQLPHQQHRHERHLDSVLNSVGY